MPRSSVTKLQNALSNLTILLHNYEGRDDDKQFNERITTVRGHVFALLRELAVTHGNEPYPLEQGRQERTIAQVCIKELPPHDDAWQIAGACSDALDELYGLEREVLERLAMIGQQVEQALGLDPLPQPPMPTDDPAA